MENNVPNLDNQENAFLWEFWKKYQHPTRKKARELFPELQPGYLKVVKLLSCYASNKGTAQKLRFQGEIAKALEYEAICQSIYSRLPEYARW